MNPVGKTLFMVDLKPLLCSFGKAQQALNYPPILPLITFHCLF